MAYEWTGHGSENTFEIDDITISSKSKREREGLKEKTNGMKYPRTVGQLQMV